MSFPPWNPYGNFVTSDPNGLPVDRRPLRLGLYLQNQTFSNAHSANGARLLQTFKYFRNMGWAGNALFGVAGVLAVTPELLDLSFTACNAGLISGVTTSIGAAGVKFYSKIQTDETTAEMETEFNRLKEQILLHNKNPLNSDKQMIIPYLADPSLSERLAEAQIAQTNSNSTNTLSNIPSNVATAGIMLEALKTFKGLRKN
jgi:hypothetical protein